MSHVVQTALNGLRIGLCFDNGIAAFGECVAPPTAEAHDVRAAYRELETMLAELPNRPVGELEGLVSSLAAGDGIWCGIAFGLETALLDARARTQGVALHALLGERRAEVVPDYLSVSAATAAGVAERIVDKGGNRSVIQLKVGVSGIQLDGELIQAARSALRHDQTLLVDANGGWGFTTAVAMIEKFAGSRLVWEEPCRTFEQNCALIAQTGAPVMLDQCVANPVHAEAAIRTGAAHSITIKPAFLGGLLLARDIVASAERAAMAVRIDGPWCGRVATAAIAHLAVTVEPAKLLSGCDLSEPLNPEALASAAGAGDLVRTRSGHIGPPSGDGLGLVPVIPTTRIQIG